MTASRSRPVPPSVAEEVEARARLRARFPALARPLPTQADIMARWAGATAPVVTVLCSTYEQGHLVADAVHGFLMQRTSFPFRIVVRDDASSDGTRRVLEDLRRRYPDLIRLVLPVRNEHEVRGRWLRDHPELEDGEFVALCEGDDVWIDPDKLQAQVDDLRRRPDHVMSVAGCLRIDVVAGTETHIGLLDASTSYRGRLGRYHHTSTFVLRSAAYAALIRDVLVPGRVGGDFAILTAAARRGGIAVLPRCVSVYWSNGRGVWSSLAPAEQLRRHCRNNRRVLLALGPPWPWDEVWRLVRLERKVLRLALRERELRIAMPRLPLVVLVPLVPPLLRLAGLTGAVLRRIRRLAAALHRARRGSLPRVRRPRGERIRP